MKRLLNILFALALASAVINHGEYRYDWDRNSSSNNISLGKAANNNDLLSIEQFLINPDEASQFAWQVQVPAGQVEERKRISWWWWVIGVFLTIGAGMLLYVWMKKDPKKDA